MKRGGRGWGARCRGYKRGPSRCRFHCIGEHRESCHCAVSSRAYGYMRARVQGMRMHTPRPASWTERSARFFAREIRSLQSVTERVYPRSQLSRPSFSSRSNNNNHYLFAYITPGLELNSPSFPPPSLVVARNAKRIEKWRFKISRVGRVLRGNF